MTYSLPQCLRIWDTYLCGLWFHPFLFVLRWPSCSFRPEPGLTLESLGNASEKWNWGNTSLAQGAAYGSQEQVSAVARMKPVSAIHSLSASSLPSSFVFIAHLHAKPRARSWRDWCVCGGWGWGGGGGSVWINAQCWGHHCCYSRVVGTDKPKRTLTPAGLGESGPVLLWLDVLGWEGTPYHGKIKNQMKIPALTLATWLCVSALTSLGLSFPFVEIGIWAWWRPIRISFLPTFPHNQTLILFGLAVHSTLQRGMAMWPVPAIRFMKKCYVQILGRLLKGKSIPSVPIPPFLPSSCFRSVIRHDGEAWQPSWTERVS